MTQTDAVAPGYRYAGETVEISQRLTEKQFREIEKILGRTRERFKEWADKFYFAPPTQQHRARLGVYLRRNGIVHTIERRETYTPAKGAGGA